MRVQNHLAHHALTLYSLGGTAESIREHFVNHEDYQTEIRPANVQIIDALSDFASLQRHLGDPDKYADFLAYFTREMKKDGYERSVNRLLFSSDSYATEIFSRMVTGLSPTPFWELISGADNTNSWGRIHPPPYPNRIRYRI